MDSREGVRRRGKIVVAGPLASLADGLRRELAGQGYALDTILDHVHLLADLSSWLVVRGVPLADLTPEVAQDFLIDRRAAERRVGGTGRALAPILGYLRALQVIPARTAVVPVTASDVLLDEYRRYLEDERGLAASTVKHYVRCARSFLGRLSGPLAEVSAGQVIDYVMTWTARREGAAQDMVTLPALRSWLRYAHVAGHIPQPLVGAVPRGRGRPRGVDVRRAVAHDQVQAVLAGCDRASAVGRRDYAMLLLLSRLAVRGGEVARLQLADVNWRSGELTIRGKGGRVDVLPLPADVGAAMADYLLRGRPSTRSRCLFVTVVAPFGGMATSTVTVMVAAACTRVGAPRFGPHGMRHGAACDLLAAGASLEEIGQLLRHAQQRTTAIYAKVDQARLAGLARPCPQGVPR